MLDQALPTFFLKPAADKIKHHESFLFTQNGTEPEATYALTHVDPASQEAKNTYAVALFDSHYPEILYGEVLSKPGWSQPSISQEEIRKNGGVAPPPQPIFPTEFAIQLYNSEQQVVVSQKTTRWSSNVSFEFSMPETTFRTPSVSSLDRSQNDPSANATTPQINFSWRKEGRKDLTCYLTGKSTDPRSKKAKRSKDPDIAVALFSGLKEITIMESNLYRVDVEDYKGLEVVILLSATVIRDLFFNNSKESYHILEPSAGGRARAGSSPLAPANVTPPVMTPQPPPQTRQPAQQSVQPTKGAALNALYNQPSPSAAKRTSLPPLRTNQQPTQRFDPRSQWEIDAETARLKAQVETEARELKRQEETNRRARRKQEQEEERKTKQFLENEERRRKQEDADRRRRLAEVDRETERLRRQFGDQSGLLPPSQPQQRHSAPLIQSTWQRPSAPDAAPAQPARPRPSQAPQAAAPQSSLGSGPPKADAQHKMKKKSFWGLRRSSDSAPNILKKKQSSMF